MDQVTCIKCGATFEAETWIPGECPHCHATFKFVDFYNEEANEEWYEIWFD